TTAKVSPLRRVARGWLGMKVTELRPGSAKQGGVSESQSALQNAGKKSDVMTLQINYMCSTSIFLNKTSKVIATYIKAFPSHDKYCLYFIRSHKDN
ncbi:hypothetical protein WA026_010115, partial [Henosepilachna vigintioctopunctata]